MIHKSLQKIREQARELVNRLESFTDASVHPTAAECDRLQQELLAFMEHVAVFKYQQVENDLSPGFALHARVSEVKPASETSQDQAAPADESGNRGHEEPAAMKQETRPSRPLSVGINDKFRFINELFAQNASEYHIAVEQLGTLKSWQEAELYLGSLKHLYGWKENSETTKLIYSTVKKRFS